MKLFTSELRPLKKLIHAEDVFLDLARVVADVAVVVVVDLGNLADLASAVAGTLHLFDSILLFLLFVA